MEKDTHSSNQAGSGSFDAKTIAVIAYLTVIGLIIAFIMNNDKKNEFSTYHIKQSLGLTLFGFGLGIIGMIPFLGWLISFLGSIFLLVLWIMGLVNALNNKKEPIPLVGDYFEEWFRNI
ncbi:DUF4870 domain-containing protein [Salinimicrobium sp. GXAS 041]|uniref:DUF4870 domain-containing protein n=1 Tax=Salinimicrobium sp. GXAS 041 TaxID=3400806 RepID=UPI003C7967F1